MKKMESFIHHQEEFHLTQKIKNNDGLLANFISNEETIDFKLLLKIFIMK